MLFWYVLYLLCHVNCVPVLLQERVCNGFQHNFTASHFTVLVIITSFSIYYTLVIMSFDGI